MVELKFTTLNEQFKYLKINFTLFISRISTYSFNGGIPIMLGIIYGNEAVAIFSVAEKLKNIAQVQLTL